MDQSGSDPAENLAPTLILRFRHVKQPLLRPGTPTVVCSHHICLDDISERRNRVRLKWVNGHEQVLAPTDVPSVGVELRQETLTWFTTPTSVEGIYYIPKVVSDANVFTSIAWGAS